MSTPRLPRSVPSRPRAEEIGGIGPADPDPRARPHLVRMRDGVRLATDVYLPSGLTEPTEAILVRLPYDKSASWLHVPEAAAYMASRGYAVVVQDIRGKFRSEGVPLQMMHDVLDGYDTLSWVEQQEWCNGRIGMWGDSYYGWTQWAAASSEHPALRAISPRVTSLVPQVMRTTHDEPFYSGRVRDVPRAYALVMSLNIYLDEGMHDWAPDWSARPLAAQFDERIAEVGRGVDFDLEYPHPFPRSIYPNGWPLDKRAVPVLVTTGWWDSAAEATWRDLERIAASPAWAQNLYVHLDATDHGNTHFDDGEAARPPLADAQRDRVVRRVCDPTLEFFEVFLRGRGAPSDIPRVRWSLAGEPGMKDSAVWPPADVVVRTLSVHPDGALRPQPSDRDGELSWVHDPLDPVPTPNPDADYLVARPDEAGLLRRRDVVGLLSEPQASALDLVGPISAELPVSSSGPVMDVFVRLLDVAPDGSAFRIAKGQLQLTDARAEHRVEVRLGHVGYRVQEGHRLALVVLSSNSPAFLIQPGTGEDPLHAVATCPNTQTLHIRAGAAPVLHLSVREPQPTP